MMTNFNESNASDAIASIAVAIGNAVSPGEGPPLFLKDLHISFVVAADFAGAPTSVAVRLVPRGDYGAHVEAQLKNLHGDLIAFAVGSLDSADRFDAPRSAIEPLKGSRGFFRTVWQVLEEMGA